MNDPASSSTPRSTTGADSPASIPTPSDGGASDDDHPASTPAPVGSALAAPSDSLAASHTEGGNSVGDKPANGRQRSWLKTLLFGKAENGWRETLEGLIEDTGEETPDDSPPLGSQERLLLQNVLQLSSITAYDVMVPRADIVALPNDTPPDEVLQTVAAKGHSRLPVYAETLDDIVGVLHVKDMLAKLAAGEDLTVGEMLRDLPIVAPSMPVLTLLLQMRETRQHMALVVDEFGGIDGLITIEDLVEQIVGEIEDEHSGEAEPELVREPAGSWLADAKTALEDFTEETGFAIDVDEDDDIDTLGGLVFSLAGRIPARGELLVHRPAGLEFQVIDADPRRIRRLRVRPLGLAAE